MGDDKTNMPPLHHGIGITESIDIPVPPTITMAPGVERDSPEIVGYMGERRTILSVDDRDENRQRNDQDGRKGEPLTLP